MTEASDRQAIEAVIRRYGAAVDAKSIDGVLACFTPDAVLDMFGGQVVVEGSEAIRALFDFTRPGALPGIDRIVHSTHLWQVDEIEFDGDADGAVTARACTSCIAYLLATLLDDGSGVLLTRGNTYRDRLSKHDHGWLISRRRHEPQWESRAAATSPLLAGSEPT